MEHAQGAAFVAEARRSSPDSLRVSRYFISPARPASTHSTKALSSGRSSCCTGAIPARSKPASKAARRAACAISCANSIHNNYAGWTEEKTQLFDGLRVNTFKPIRLQLSWLRLTERRSQKSAF